MTICAAPVLLAAAPVLLAFQPAHVRSIACLPRSDGVRRCPPLTAAADSDDDSSRMRKRQKRRLFEGGEDADYSEFDEIFASLREEEERAIAAAQEEQMLAYVQELDGDVPASSDQSGRNEASTSPTWARPLYEVDGADAAAGKLTYTPLSHSKSFFCLYEN